MGLAARHPHTTPPQHTARTPPARHLATNPPPTPLDHRPAKTQRTTQKRRPVGHHALTLIVSCWDDGRAVSSRIRRHTTYVDIPAIDYPRTLPERASVVISIGDVRNALTLAFAVICVVADNAQRISVFREDGLFKIRATFILDGAATGSLPEDDGAMAMAKTLGFDGKRSGEYLCRMLVSAESLLVSIGGKLRFFQQERVSVLWLMFPLDFDGSDSNE